MRKLFWFTAGVVIASAMGAYAFTGSRLLIFAAVCLAAGLALAFWNTKPTKIITATLIGCMVGFVWFWVFDLVYLKDARQYDGQTVMARVEVCDYSYKTEYGYGTDGKIALNNKNYRIRFYSQGESYRPGDLVEGTFTIRFTATGGEKTPTHHQGKNIFLLANCPEPLHSELCESVPLKYKIAQFRHSIRSAIQNVFAEDTEGFAMALLLGDSSGLGEKEDNSYAISGIRHIIAVSGLHVSIICALLYFITAEEERSSAILGIPMLIVFAAVSGFTPSVMRAVIMQATMLFGLAIKKEYDSLTSLALAVLAMLAFNPLTVTSVSFQLSAGCTLSILLFSVKIHDYLLKKTPLGPAKGKTRKARFIRWFVNSVSISVSAMILTIPLCAYHFGIVSLVSVLTNLLTLWVIPTIFYGIMLAAAGAVWLPLGKLIAWCFSWLIRYVQVTAGLMSKIPFAAVYPQDVYVFSWLIFAYILFAVFMLMRNKRPVIFICSVVACLAVCLTLSSLERKQDDFRVTILDVGQGQSVLLQSREEAYLVDCGGDSGGMVADTVRKHMLAHGIKKLDGVILTHYDADHANGLMNFLEAVPVDKLYLPATDCDTDMKDRILAAHQEISVMVHQDITLALSNAKLTIYSAEQTRNENDNSLCILFQPENCDILITGDRTSSGEKALLDRAQLPELEILIVGHHGAENSASLELLEALRPKDVVVSVGAENSFGHPAKETLLRLFMYDCRIWRTDKNGTVCFRG